MERDINPKNYQALCSLDETKFHGYFLEAFAGRMSGQKYVMIKKPAFTLKRRLKDLFIGSENLESQFND